MMDLTAGRKASDPPQPSPRLTTTKSFQQGPPAASSSSSAAAAAAARSPEKRESEPSPPVARVPRMLSARARGASDDDGSGSSAPAPPSRESFAAPPSAGEAPEVGARVTANVREGTYSGYVRSRARVLAPTRVSFLSFFFNFFI